jgi:two-component system chemotaxis response regulator CheY
VVRDVLLVEDDDDVREMMTVWLCMHGFRVHPAANGAAALNVLEVLEPDVILLDLMMPVMSGWAFCEALASTPRPSSPPIVVVSALSNAPPLAIAPAARLNKPLDLATLLATIETIRPSA